MKREIKGFVLGALATTLIMGLGTGAIALGVRQNINVEVNASKVISSGTTIGEDTLLWNDKTYIPLRSTLEAANCIVDWDADTNTANVRNAFFFPDITRVAVNSKMLPAHSVVAYKNSDGSYTQYVDAVYLCNLLGISYTYEDVGGEAALNIKTTATTPSAATPTTTTQIDTAYKNRLLSRASTVLRTANNKLSTLKASLQEAENRGMGRSSYADSIRNDISENESNIEEIQELYNGIKSATTNDELSDLEKTLVDFESIY